MRFLFAAIVTLAFTLGAQHTQAADLRGKSYTFWSKKEIWPADSCTSPKILNRIKKRFEKSQRKTFHRDLSIVELHNPHRYASRENHPTFHDRQYCKAKAQLSNGRHHSVYYLLSHDGFPPLGNGLVWCMIGYDYFRAYAPGCRQVRPY